MTALSSTNFWARLLVQHVARGPAAHLMNLLQNLSVLGGGMVELTTKLHQRIAAEWYPILSDHALEDMNLLGALQHWVGEDKDLILSNIVLCTLSAAAEFHKRITIPCNSWPRKLLLVLQEDGGIHSDERQRLAQDLLSDFEVLGSALNPCTRKITILFFDDIVHMKNTGQCTERFFEFMQDIPLAT